MQLYVQIFFLPLPFSPFVTPIICMLTTGQFPSLLNFCLIFKILLLSLILYNLYFYIFKYIKSSTLPNLLILFNMFFHFRYHIFHLQNGSFLCLSFLSLSSMCLNIGNIYFIIAVLESLCSNYFYHYDVSWRFFY